MALRCVARSIGVPALRRASVSRVSLAAGSGRPLASRSPQAGYNNYGGAGQKQSSQEIMEGTARYKASFQATADAIERERRMKKIERRLYIGSAALGVGLGIYTCLAIIRKAQERVAAREEARVRGTWV
ncbi:unnamed protein product [Urochloa humidicola]